MTAGGVMDLLWRWTVVMVTRLTCALKMALCKAFMVKKERDHCGCFWGGADPGLEGPAPSKELLGECLGLPHTG